MTVGDKQQLHQTRKINRRIEAETKSVGERWLAYTVKLEVEEKHEIKNRRAPANKK